MKNWIAAASFAAAGMTLGTAAHATAYYVSDCQTGASAGCVAGNDSNAGTSAASPWKSASKVASAFPSLKAGDQVLFAKGGSWNFATGMALSNASATSAAPIVLDQYTPSSGATAKPILKFTGDGSGGGAGLFDFHGSGQQGFTIQNLDLRGSGAHANWGFFIYNNVANITIQNNVIDGFGAGVYCAAAPNSPNKGLQILNNTIRNNTSMGVLLGCGNLLVQGNTFDNNGVGGGVGDHSIYLDGDANAYPAKLVYNATIRGNTITRNTMTNGVCQSAVIVVHNAYSNLLIENNTLTQALGDGVGAGGGCYGIALTQGNADAEVEGFIGATIRGNTITNAGYVSVEVSNCQNCVIENNVINQQNSVESVGIRIGGFSSSANDLVQSQVQVRNNSIYFGNPSADSIGISFIGAGTGHTNVSNLLYFGSNSGISYCFSTSMAASAFAGWDNNLCYSAGGNSGRWAVGQSTRTALTSAMGFDTKSLSSNPLLATTPVIGSALSMALGATSPAVNAGHPTLSAPRDINNVVRSQPDIGAYEWGTATADTTPPGTPTSVSVQ